MYRRQNQSQQPKRERENPAFDDVTDLGQEAYGPYDVPGPAPFHPYEALNAANTTYEKPYAGPALPDRPTRNPHQNLNQKTTKPKTTPLHLKPTTTPVSLAPNVTPDYLELHV